MEEYTYIKVDTLRQFTTSVFEKFGVPTEDAKITTDVLISADQRGVSSHGLQRLGRYINGLKVGVMKPVAKISVLKETPNTLLISGDDGLGQVVGYKAMKLVIEKALKNNVALASVCNSNHYGMAAYYSMMALDKDLIGISLTNSEPLLVPTYGKDAVIGTNPISIAVPTGEERPFVLDMATSTVPRGKLEVRNRAGESIPNTWATDELGNPTTDPSRVLKNIRDGRGGGLLPLGGAEEKDGGHKGYGLAFAVDIFCGVLSGSVIGLDLYSKEGASAKISHFFGAIKIEAFVQLVHFRRLMDEYIAMIRNSAKATGQNRIFIHGEKELELHEQRKNEVPVLNNVVEEIRRIGEEVSVKAPF